MNKLRAWVQASRLPSQTYILFPLIVGQGLALQIRGTFDGILMGWVTAFSFLIQFYIVYANDYADEFVDELNTTYNMFSGGSRVLMEKKLTRQDLKYGIGIVLALLVCLGGFLHIVYGRHLYWVLLMISCGLLWAYSYPPFRLSYRGGGEWLQGAGVGVVLPLTGYYLQAGSWAGFPWWCLPYFLLFQYTAALVSSLPDEPSDRQGQKRTAAVRWGIRSAIRWILILYFVSFIMLAAWVFSAKDQRASVLVVSIPACVAYLGMLCFQRGALPGNQRMNRLVGAGIALAVLQMAGLGYALWFFAGILQP